MELLYRFFIYPLLRGTFTSLAFLLPKVRSGLKMRRPHNGQAPWLAFPLSQRPIWIHCASGEFEYAKPVITRLKHARPDCKILVTYFSPSIAKAVHGFAGVDYATPLPWDRRPVLQKFLAHHQPRLLLIARTDTWPMMLRESARAGLPTLLFSATLARGSGRARWWARPFSRFALSPLREIFAVTDEDVAAFETLGLGDRTRRAGDTRYDQVIERLEAPKPIREELFAPSRVRLIAGSTWKEDEVVLIATAAALKGRIDFVLVPHEPTADHIAQLRRQVHAAGLTAHLYSTTTAPTAGDVLIVDRIGILAELYQNGRFAFVGGSFRKTVHSVMEPLAAGCVTFVGPKHQNNREALEFRSVSVGGAGSATGSTDFHGVEAVATAVEFTHRLEQALGLPEPETAARLRAEIARRSGKSDDVVDWCLKNYEGP